MERSEVSTKCSSSVYSGAGISSGPYPRSSSRAPGWPPLREYSRGTAPASTVADAVRSVHRQGRCGARSAPMGIPVTRECALPGCETLSSSTRAKDGGVYFDVSVLFAPREARKPSAGEVCAVADRCSIVAFPSGRLVYCFIAN